MQTVSDIMTRGVISVLPTTSLLEAARIVGEHKVDGVPVVDDKKTLVGILTEYDLVSKGSLVHLPTLQKVLESLRVEGHNHLDEDMRELKALKVRDVMNTDPLTLSPDATMEETVALFHNHHRVNPVPIIDAERKVIGVVSRYDIVKLFQLAATKET